jgi:hypothetical protein
MGTGQKRSSFRSLVICAAMAALALALPIAFHMVGFGSEFLPLLLPLLVNAFLVPAVPAVATAAATPLLSAFATGMPPLYPPVAVLMSIEAAVMSAVAAVLRRRCASIWFPLLAAIAAGRLTTAALTIAIAPAFELPARATGLAILVQGLPGVILQILVVPLAVRALRRRSSPLFREDEE